MVLNLSVEDDNMKWFLVVHEFGHALGLGHMHQMSLLGKALDEKRAKAWIRKEYMLHDATEEFFDANFKPYTGKYTKEIGHFDAASVMCYP